eukprot:CAMPEP_0204570198 /NCGR_PEP_ID=MMETSP0661-20131031/38172_1 /ASSEMBLY_ACC=CAM_ASM_000606 /TAXON_ID=109239 /ORGANISM="Alexandrium margalefi, Strain AMGDE01CS-322" /LENGTH=936 /DNA_ID=CAMNT_0051578369 /DNA_START=82 /DNA_END=2892 /DNA_ORIENTATION=+
MLGYNPFINGLHIGQLVEITGGSMLVGEVGQLQEYLPDSKKFKIIMLSTGSVITVDPDSVVSAGDCAGPGQGGTPEDFDIVIGPQTGRGPLGDTIAECLGSKGFCVARIAQGSEDLLKSFDEIKDLEAKGEFGRLASEVEEGYLGKNSRGKVMWLDPDTDSFSDSSTVKRNDGNISSIAELLLPYSENVLGAAITERTPALLCLSMSDTDEAEYENPVGTDRMIEEFYSTWYRGLLRIMHFMGPSSGKATLTLKKAAPITNLEDSYEINLPANTILIVRDDTFDYTYAEPEDGEAAWLTAFFLKPGPQWSMSELEGDTGILNVVGAGPPPPTQDLVAVCGISIQATGKMTDHHKEWAAYAAGTDGQMEMPFARFDYKPYYASEVDMPLGTTYVKHFSVQEGIELFDNKAFEISNMEAESMDPLCRQVMEVGYLSVFQLGITKKYCNTNPTHASVSVGCDKQEWLTMPDVPRSVATNNQLAICANRFNYSFNLKGGSYLVDTACSSSLVAGHLGKVNLLERRWDPLEWHLGLGAGVTLSVGSFIGSCASHMLSPGGRCFTFNSTANGYNRGDGTAAMLIKVGPNDEHRFAYFRGSQMGQDGRSASMSAPNGPAQEKCVWGAIREARMTPPESTVWECHGTGTSLGDPIEVGAVRKVQIKMQRMEPLMMASSKSNFGHLEGSAAAMAMNKCVMVVIKITCAATIHLKTLNPHLDHAAFDAIFITELNPYKYKQGHCQVSSFGVGGTNGHAIFWGEGVQAEPDYKKMFMSKMLKAPTQIIADGNDPSQWEYNGPSFDASPDDHYRIVLIKDPMTDEETFTYEKVTEEVELVEFYCTTGNHNDWAEDRMMEGDVPGLFYQEVDVPEGGELEFRILAEGDPDKVIAPANTTSRKLEAIMGPSKDLRTSWIVKAEPGSAVRVEFFAPAKGSKSITWLLLKDE